MSSEVKDPKIKLFGKTILLLAADTSGGGGAGAVDENSVSDSVPEETNFNGDGDEQDQELHKGLSGTQQTESQEEGQAKFSTSEEFKESNMTTPQSEEGSKMEKASDIEEENQDDTSNSEEVLKKPDMIIPCPRCNSMETKFCYFNNYNVNQPRHYCKNCQRYWTAGGTMRNVPVGAGRRRYKHVPPQYRRIMGPEPLTGGQIGFPNGIHQPALSPSGSAPTVIHHPALSPSGSGPSGIHLPALSPCVSGPSGIHHPALSSSGSVQPGIHLPALSPSASGPAGIHHPALSPSGNGIAFRSFTPFCESMVSGLSMAETVRHHHAEELEVSRSNGDEDNQLSVSSLNQIARVGLEMIPNHHLFPPQMPGFLRAPWTYPFYPTFMPLPGVPGQFYPAGTPPFWNCTVPGSWNTPLIIPPMQLPPSQPAPSSGPNSPTLGKHSREDNTLNLDNNNQGETTRESDPDNCFWVPKTIRIDDPEEAAKSSIWATLDITREDDSGVGGSGLCNAFQSKSKSDENADAPETSTVLQANPAALSRSVNFHESS